MNRKLKLNPQEIPYADCENSIEYPSGLKWTKQRRSVYKVLWEAKEPLSAIQIYNRVEIQEGAEEYAVSTIYRILAAFEEKGLVEKITWAGDDAVGYALNRGGHTHYAVCLECRKRIPLQGCPFAHVRLEEETGDFVVTGHKLELYGYCKDCRSGQKEQPEITPEKENAKK